MPGGSKTGSERAFVSFSGKLNLDSTEALIGAAAELCGEGVTELVLCVSCFGGNFDRAVSLYNTLRALPLKLVTHNVGNVGSAAIVLFLAGEERYACPQTVFFFHPSSVSLEGSFEPQELARERVELLESDAREREIIAQRTRLGAREIRALVNGSRTIGAERALDAGLIDAIRELQIPRGARLVKV